MKNKTSTIVVLIMISSFTYLIYTMLANETLFFKLLGGEFNPRILLIIHGILIGFVIKMILDRYTEK
jgi:uncharacterized membrane protein (DUF106 family)